MHDYKDLILQAVNLGCVASVRKSGHIHIITPAGRKVIASSSKPRGRGRANLRARLRRAGVLVR
jgi:hypothetical protein